MYEENYDRQIQSAVTCFLYCGDKYLFLKRGPHKKVDPNRLNGVGGRLERNEDFLTCAIREIEEETGYVVAPSDVRLAGVVKLQGGYRVDYVMCFFKVRVYDTKIPKGDKTEDGELLWLDKDNVLDRGHDLTDDINYCFKDIVDGEKIFFMSANLDEQQKVSEVNIAKL